MRTRGWIVALLTLSLAACASLEEPREEPTVAAQNDPEGLVLPESLELEAALGESVSASFRLFNNTFEQASEVRATTFALSWIDITSGNTQTVAPFAEGVVTFEATCDEAVLERLKFLDRPDDELSSSILVQSQQGVIDFESVDITLKCT